MIYRDFQGEKLSALGFGAMRLPLMGGEKNAPIDEDQVREMVRLAIEGGVNYFDTAYPYHGGESERVLGRALSQYPRASFYLADKYPGHQIADRYDPADVFEKQLEKCGVDYFDFYLLHNVYENSVKVYTDPQWGIIDYFLEQKRRGRIRHLGFSTHGGLPCMTDFLDRCGDDMEFCQIQLNYVDWTLQQAAEKVALLNERGIPVWVMEPVRGGRLAHLSDADEARLKALRPDESTAAWAFRWLQGVKGVGVILSGMSSLDQMRDNLSTFAHEKPLTPEETETLLDIAEGMKGAIPCTGCRYCTAGCPMGLDIPTLLGLYNDVRFVPSFNASMRVEAMPEDKRPAACVGCGACAAICPQKIDIPAAMRDFADKLSTMPSWAEISRQRAAAQK